LKGAFHKNPKRGVARANEPDPVGDIGEAPAYLDEKEKACWHEIVKMCHAGSLCAADALIVEHGARVLAALRASPVYEDVKLMVRLEATLGKLGLTPADRSKVQVVKAKAVENPFAKFKATS
jgi:phage terminase small subunit